MKSTICTLLVIVAVGVTSCSVISGLIGGDSIIIKNHMAYYADDTLGATGVAAITPDTGSNGNVSFSPPVVRSRREPEYPRLASRLGIQGEMVIRAMVGSDGHVRKAVVVRDKNGIVARNDEYLEDATLRAAMGYTYYPALYGGKPIPYPVTIRFEYKLIGTPPRFSTLGYNFEALGFEANDTCALRIGYSVPSGKLDLQDRKIDSTDETPPGIIKQVTPEYPYGAELVGVEGRVWIKLWLSKSGEVIYAAVANTTNVGFNVPTLYAAIQYRFSPAKYRGRPIGVWVLIPFTFRFRGD
jgi:TonB family protein